MADRNSNHRPEARRGAVRTALVLGAVVALIYLSFVGRAVLDYFGS